MHQEVEFEEGAKVEMFSIRDSKAGAFLQPWFSPTVESALRAVCDHLENEEDGMARHPDDYCLYHLGRFDFGSGFLSPLPAPEAVALLSSLKQRPFQVLSMQERLEAEHPEWCFKDGCDCENSIAAREARQEVSNA